MIVGTCKIFFRAEWVCSLKEKRMVVQSIIHKVQHRFNVSIAEVEQQDKHRTIVIGFACVSNTSKHADQMIQTIINFIEGNTDAQIFDIEIEVF